MTQSLLLIAMVLMCGSPARALLVAEDGFDIGMSGYTANASIDDKGQGLGWSDNWQILAGSMITTSSSAAYTGLLEAGSGKVTVGATGNPKIVRHFTTTPNGEFWVALVVSCPQTVSYDWIRFQLHGTNGSVYWGLSCDQTNNVVRAVVNTWNNFSTLSGAIRSTQTYAAGTNHLIVLRVRDGIDGTGGNDICDVWVDPSTSSTPSDQNIASSITLTSQLLSSTSKPDAIYLDYDGTVDTGSFSTDELRIGTTYQAVMGQRDGNEYYVATNGDDSGSGTESQPWQTIHKAANTLISGDTVYIKAGTYYIPSCISIVNSGTPGNWITFMAYPGDELDVIIDGVNMQNSSHGFYIYNAKNYIWLQGLRIQNITGSGIWAEATANSATGLRVVECSIYNTSSIGIAVMGLNFSPWGGQPDKETQQSLYTDIILIGNEIEKTNEPSGVNECISIGKGVDDIEVAFNYIDVTN